MAIRYEIEKFGYAFPTKVLSTRAGHNVNIVLEEDSPNGAIVGVGDYVSFDQYKEATAPSNYEAKIIDTAADGNFYVQVTKIDPNAPAVLIYEVPEISENYNAKFTNNKNFYNEAGKTVRGLVLNVLDVYELSAELFDGTPAVGKTVTVDGRKHVVEADVEPTTYSVVFTVKDSSENAVSGATITMNSEEKTTDAEGKATFTVEAGTYNYSVAKASYTTVTNSVTVTNADAPVAVTLTA